MAVDHYENFPVASWLLPRHLRAAVRDIYRFARSADDIADEGSLEAAQRLTGLAAYRSALKCIANGREDTIEPGLRPVFLPLARTVHQHGLPLTPFEDLLSAFEQDVHKTRYQDDAELFDYCRRSANPVGRIVLALYGAATGDRLKQSDAICTGLQLVNFWQDIAIDWHKDRLYLPLEKLAASGLDESYIARRAGTAERLPADPRWETLMRTQVAQARSLLMDGLPLAGALPGRTGLELAMVVHGGLRILARLDELHYEVFTQRPTLGRLDWPRILWKALASRRQRNPSP